MLKQVDLYHSSHCVHARCRPGLPILQQVSGRPRSGEKLQHTRVSEGVRCTEQLGVVLTYFPRLMGIGTYGQALSIQPVALRKKGASGLFHALDNVQYVRRQEYQ